MIVVAGFNTALDRFIEVEALRLGAVNRARSGAALPGGKGVHVALTVAALGEPVRLVGPIDAGNDARFRRFLSERGVEFRGVPVKGEIRTCLAVREADGRITELLEPGPALDAGERSALIARVTELAEADGIVVLTGSLPPGMPDSTYADTIGALRHRGVRCLLDTSGAALAEGLTAGPFLVKPNRDEAEGLAGKPIASPRDAWQALQSFSERGARRAILSRGAEGALVLWEGRRYRVRPPAVDAINPVGSGDCFLGGLAVGLRLGSSVHDSLRLAAACGAANAARPETGAVSRDAVEALVRRASVEEVPDTP